MQMQSSRLLPLMHMLCNRPVIGSFLPSMQITQARGPNRQSRRTEVRRPGESIIFKQKCISRKIEERWNCREKKKHEQFKTIKIKIRGKLKTVNGKKQMWTATKIPELREIYFARHSRCSWCNIGHMKIVKPFVGVGKVPGTTTRRVHLSMPLFGKLEEVQGIWWKWMEAVERNKLYLW